jgi:hypothetical protein
MTMATSVALEDQHRQLWRHGCDQAAVTGAVQFAPPWDHRGRGIPGYPASAAAASPGVENLPPRCGGADRYDKDRAGEDPGTEDPRTGDRSAGEGVRARSATESRS